MWIAYAVLAIVVALMVTASGVMKIRRDPQVVKVIHDLVGVPLTFLPVLAACEFAGAVGLVAGIRWPSIGLAAAAGLIVYFVGAVIGHLRIGDAKGIGPAAFMLGLSIACGIVRALAA
jgi:uncharacterized membrane protein YphA (DoxX/SURF4 family)